MRNAKNLFRWLNVILILITFLSYLSPFISPAQFWPVNFFGIAYPWLLLANLLFAAAWLIMRSRYAFFSIACILMGWSHLTAFWGFNYFSGNSSIAALKVMSYNVQYFAYINENNKQRAARMVMVSNFFKQEDPDIICLQENNSKRLLLPDQLLNYAYVHDEPEKGTAIFSKFPIIKKGSIDFGTKTNSCLWADIKKDDQVFRVYSLHLQSNQVSGIADQVIKKGDLQQKETWIDIRGMIGRVKRAATIRVSQATKVKSHMVESPHPLILCADLNDTPLSYVYHILNENTQDAFRAKGKGIGTTYAGSIPALRIDFILASDNIRVLDYKVLRKEFSDHYPVICSLQLSP